MPVERHSSLIPVARAQPMAAWFVRARQMAINAAAFAGACLALALVTLALAAAPASAQGWWPFSNSEPTRPRAPDRPPPAPIPPQGMQPGQGYGQAPLGQRAPGASAPICVQLEQRLIAETQRGSQTRSLLPKIDEDTRTAEKMAALAQSQLERGDCYEYFLFQKTLRRTQSCVQAASQYDAARRQLSELSVQRQQLLSTPQASYQDDIIRELARNGCGSNWTQEARKRESSGFGGIFSEGEADNDGSKPNNGFGNLPFATYRTVCVRLCDGYFFPVSFSTLPNHFSHDVDQCQSHCAAPTDLYYYQNPGADIRQAMSVKNQTPYTGLKTAFLYTKQYVQGCSCKEAEYVPAAGDKKAEAPQPGIPGSPSVNGGQRQAARLP